jgi:enamine deaminase RidA (YjgF/YER057c/UK114 family)
MPSVYERLKNLQISLPNVPPPVVDRYVAAFVPFVRTGNLIYLSGRLAKKNGKLCIEVFEERGAHARSAVGVSQIPFGCCVEIEMVVETFVSASE